MKPHESRVSTTFIINLHAHGTQRLDDAEEEISVEKQTPVCQPVRLDIAGLAGQKSLFRFLERETERRKYICGDANDNHLY